jgi:hypothetical protein
MTTRKAVPPCSASCPGAGQVAVRWTAGSEYGGLAAVYQFGELANKLMHPRFGLSANTRCVLGALSQDEKALAGGRAAG